MYVMVFSIDYIHFNMITVILSLYNYHLLDVINSDVC